MMPHLKKWSEKEKTDSRLAFDEGSKQRMLAMKNQKRLTYEEMMLKLNKKNPK